MSIDFEEATIPEVQQSITDTRDSISPGEIVIGTLHAIDEQGRVLVDFSANLSAQPIAALSTVALTPQQQGRNLALLFAEGDLNKPVVMGLINNPLHDIIEQFEVTTVAADKPAQKQPGTEDSTLSGSEVVVDGKRVVMEAQDEIVLKCGEASITLTRAGKILIRGKYLLNRSDGMNRIQGGSIQLN